MMGVFKNYYSLNKQFVKKAYEMDSMFNAAVSEMFNEDLEIDP